MSKIRKVRQESLFLRTGVLVEVLRRTNLSLVVVRLMNPNLNNLTKIGQEVLDRQKRKLGKTIETAVFVVEEYNTRGLEKHERGQENTKLQKVGVQKFLATIH